MSRGNTAEKLSHVERQLDVCLRLLRDVQHDVWDHENRMLAAQDRIAELEQAADPLYDGAPLLDRLSKNNHAA